MVTTVLIALSWLKGSVLPEGDRRFRKIEKI